LVHAVSLEDDKYELISLDSAGEEDELTLDLSEISSGILFISSHGYDYRYTQISDDEYHNLIGE